MHGTLPVEAETGRPEKKEGGRALAVLKKRLNVFTPHRRI